MRAVVLERFGGPEVLTLRDDVEPPGPGPDEVVVAVESAALNRADLMQRLGFYPGPKLFYGDQVLDVPGMEFAGRVIEAGARVVDAKVGDLVMGIVGGGAYAERVVVHERQLLGVPRGVEGRDAAAIPEVFLTAWDALVVQGGLTAGRTALVHAGASGVGTAAIQVARAMSAVVIVTASAGKLARCRELGAHLAVERTPSDWLSEVRAFAPRGVDVVLDVVGGDELERNVDALAVQGRIVQVGTMGGGQATFSLGKLLPKRATLVGTVLRARPIEEKLALTRRFAREVLPWFDAPNPRLRPVIDRRFPLAEVADAHRYMESNANIGKILLEVGGT